MRRPTPEEIRAARTASGLTQAAAAALIGKTCRAWQYYEADVSLKSHRKMDPMLWEMWQIKLAERG
jgi:transcriptional regulator with XRE-family HTH domain